MKRDNGSTAKKRWERAQRRKARGLDERPKKGPASTPRFVDRNHSTIFQHKLASDTDAPPIDASPGCRHCYGTGRAGRLLLEPKRDTCRPRTKEQRAAVLRTPLLCACVQKNRAAAESARTEAAGA